MTPEKIDRINELARASRERELSAEEKAEQQTLRREYIADWRRATENALSNTYVVDEAGNKRKLKKK